MYSGMKNPDDETQRIYESFNQLAFHEVYRNRGYFHEEKVATCFFLHTS